MRGLEPACWSAAMLRADRPEAVSDQRLAAWCGRPAKSWWPAKRRNGNGRKRNKTAALLMEINKNTLRHIDSPSPPAGTTPPLILFRLLTQIPFLAALTWQLRPGFLSSMWKRNPSSHDRQNSFLMGNGKKSEKRKNATWPTACERRNASRERNAGCQF